MSGELGQLRIQKHQKASRNERVIWPWVVGILLLGGAGAGAWQWRNSTGGGIEVETVKVHAEDGARSSGEMVALSANGYVMAAHKIELASKVTGRVLWVGVEMGDKIKKGQVLVRLEDDEYKARVQQQQGQLDSAKARLAELEAGSRPEEVAQAKALLDRAMIDEATAERTFKRTQEMMKSGATNQVEVDNTEDAVKAAQAQVESVREQFELIKEGPRKEQIAAQAATVHQLEGSLAMMSVDLANTVITSPLDSTVLERNVEVGEFVTNGFVGDRGAKGYVLSLADLDDLLVELDIDQANFARVTQDQPCWIVADAYPDKKYAGKVELISPLANRQKATVQVRVRVVNPDGLLKPDMNATVSFLAPKAAGTAAEQPAAILVPGSALRGDAVFIVVNDKAVKQVVVTGLKDASGKVEIKKGLIGGEDLILSPVEGLKDGDSVRRK